MTPSLSMRCLLPSVAVLAFLLVGMARASEPFFRRPNVILIVTDDQGYGDMSCHGNPWLHTPNLDRLYAESVRLEDYHVEPVCTPTRGSLMTGRYASRVGAWAATQGRQLLGPGKVTMADVFSDAGMRGKKGSVFEGGHRVACFVRWPDRLKAGYEVKQLTSCRDWLPTLIELCDLHAPKDLRFDGQSLAPLLNPSAQVWPDRTLFVERQGDRPSLGDPGGPRARYPHYAVLTERWRLVDGALFNIENDPGQQRNVAPQHADVVRDLRARYEKHFVDVFSDNAAYTRFQLGAREENPTLLTVRDWHPTEGNVIWKQEQLGDDTLAINGFWAVNVVRAGRYSIRLSRFPDDAPQAMRATKAILRIGEHKLKKDLQGSESDVTFGLDLQQGPALLQSCLSDERGNVRGAYFAEVTFQHP